MAPRVFNTLTRGKEDLVPVHAGEIRIYVCGVTVYDLSHIGHGRSAIVFDVMRRYLRHRGHAVKFVKNFTDIDDKIIRKANQEGVSAQEKSRKLQRSLSQEKSVVRRLNPALRKAARFTSAWPVRRKTASPRKLPSIFNSTSGGSVKVQSPSGEKKRALPPVGRTWFGPAM